MQNSSFARLPQGLDPELRRALEILVLKVDEAYGKRGTGFVVQGQSTLTKLQLSVSNPPTQSELQAVADKVDEIISVLQASKLVLT